MSVSGERLRTLREQKNLSRQALADLAGVSKSNLKRLETGDGAENTTISTLTAVAKVLDVEVADLLEGNAA